MHILVFIKNFNHKKKLYINSLIFFIIVLKIQQIRLQKFTKYSSHECVILAQIIKVQNKKEISKMNKEMESDRLNGCW